MRYLSVCSGIEAATVAWHNLGWQAVGFAEIEKFPAKVLAHHYPTVPNFGDLTKHDQWPLESGAVDLLVGGTPCQSFSVAGLRRGLDDSRGQLTFEYVRLAQRLRPRWIVWENVPGVLSSGGGQDFAAFLSGLSGRDIQPPDTGWKNSGVIEPSAISNVWAKLLDTHRGLQSRPVQLRGQQDRHLSSTKLPGMPEERFDGNPSFYGIAWRVLDAQYFGVAQRRRRVFVVGYLGDWRRAAAVLFERESVRGDSAPSRKARQSFAADAAPSLVASGRGCARTGDSRGQDPVVAVAGCLASRSTSGGGFSTDFECAGGLQVVGALDCGIGNVKAQNAQNGHMIPSWPAEVAPTLNAHFGSKQGLEDQHALGGAGHFVPAVFKTITTGEGFRNDFETCTMIPSRTHALTSRHGSEDGTGRGVPIVPVAFSQNQLGEVRTGEVMNTINTNSNASGRNTPMMVVPIDLRNAQRDPDKHDAVNRQGTGVAMDGDPAHTVTSACVHGVATAMQVRRLTPVECERLQGFPDGYTDIKPRGKDTPDGPRYKALGNSMAVPVMRWIGERIAKVEDITKG